LAVSGAPAGDQHIDAAASAAISQRAHSNLKKPTTPRTPPPTRAITSSTTSSSMPDAPVGVGAVYHQWAGSRQAGVTGISRGAACTNADWRQLAKAK
jgi:hypothetical protein